MDINFVGVLAAAFLAMVTGTLWYSPVMFGNSWMRAIGKSRETLGSPVKSMLGALLASLLSALGVALVHSLIPVDSLIVSVHVGLILGGLIVFPALFSDHLFCGWKRQLLYIQSGYRMVSLLLMSILYSWIYAMLAL